MCADPKAARGLKALFAGEIFQRPMLDAVMASLPALTEDQFGNYVVQHLLEFGRREDKE